MEASLIAEVLRLGLPGVIIVALVWDRVRLERRIDSLTERLAEKDRQNIERMEASAEKDRLVHTRNADAILAVASASKETHGLQLRTIDQVDQLTSKTGQLRDEVIARPRSSASDASFQSIKDKGGRR